MSSHHIIRENQEPALIVNSTTAVDTSYLGQLLEWSPSVLTSDYFVDFLLAEGIKVDVVFSVQKEWYGQEHIKFMPLEKSFLRESLVFLVENNYKAVNIITDSIEDVFFEMSAFINIVALVEGIRYVFVKGEYKKWLPKGERVLVREDCLKSLVGIRRTGNNEFVTVADDFIYLAFNTTCFVSVGESI